VSLEHTAEEVAFLNFWYEFDNMFTYAMPDDVKEAMDVVEPYGRLFSKYQEYRNQNDYPEGFKTEFQGDVESFTRLGDRQLELLHKHFKEDKTLEKNAFTTFAQGTLFDDLPRPPNLPKREGFESIHMMNSDTLGYVMWHAFIMALVLIDDKANKERWLEIDKYLVLAASIFEKLTELGSRPVRATEPGKNKPLDESHLKELENHWLQSNISFEQIDKAMGQMAGI
jgi:hypothetical protein